MKRKRFKQAAALLTATAALVNMATPALAKSDVTCTYIDAQSNPQTTVVKQDVPTLNEAVSIAEGHYQQYGNICTVTVTEDETVSQTVELHDSVTLDLNGHEVKLDSSATTEEAPVIAVCAPAAEETKTTSPAQGDSKKEITITSSATATDADGNTVAQNGVVSHADGTGTGILVDLTGDANDANAPAYDITIEHVTVEGNTAKNGGGITIIGETAAPAEPTDQTTEGSTETTTETTTETPTGQSDENSNNGSNQTTPETVEVQSGEDSSNESDDAAIEPLAVQSDEGTVKTPSETSESQPTENVSEGSSETTDEQPAAEPVDQVKIDDCVIQNNTATQSGGGIIVQGDVGVQITSTTIANNKSTQSGGGVAVQDAATVQIESSVIADNKTFLSGGGIYSADSSVTLVDSTVTGNKALYGGGIAIEGGTLVLQDDQSTTCVAANVTCDDKIGKGDDLYLAPSKNGTSAFVTLNEANGTLYPGLDMKITDWYVDGVLNDIVTHRWLEKYGDDIAYLETYPASTESESEPVQTIGAPIEITGVVALKAAYLASTLEGDSSSGGNPLLTEPGATMNETNSGVSGSGNGSGSGSGGSNLGSISSGGSYEYEYESTASRLTSLGGRGRGNIRQELPIGQHGGPIIRPISGPIARPWPSGTTQASNTGFNSIRPATTKTGTPHKPARTSDDLPFASAALALCCALLRKKRPYRTLRRILLHK